MKKLGIISGVIVAILLIAWLGGMAVLGGGIKKGAEDWFEDAADSNSMIQQADIVEYKKGFASSTAKTVFKIAPDGSEEPIEIPLKQEIKHGPLLFTPEGVKIGTSYTKVTVDTEALPEKAKDFFDRAFVEKEPVQIHFTSGVSKGFTKVKVEPLDHRIETEAGEKVKVKFNGIDGTFQGDFDGEAASGEMKIGALSIGDEEFKIEWDEGTMKLDADELLNGTIIDGQMRTVIPKVSVFAAGDTYRVKDVEITQSGKEEGDKFSSNTMISFGEVRVPTSLQEQFGDFISNGLTIETTAKNIRKTTFEAMQESIKEAQKAATQTADDPEAANIAGQKAGVEISKQMLQLMEPGFLFEFAIDMRGGEGRSNLSLELEWVAGEPLLELETLRKIIGGLRGEIKLTLPASLAQNESTAGFVQLGAMQGMLKVEENEINTTARIVHSNAFLNDQKFPLLEMMGPGADEKVNWDEIFAKALENAEKTEGSDAVPPGIQ